MNKTNDITKLEIGDKIPSYLGLNQNGKEINLSDLKGQKLIIYFYPKDNTPGCTAEACSLKDNINDLEKSGYKVIGVSADSKESHKKFENKYELPFDLIADTNKDLIKSFGVWGEKKMAGKVYDGILRTTFLVDENGIITQIITPKEIKTKIHGSQILDLLNDDKKD